MTGPGVMASYITYYFPNLAYREHVICKTSELVSREMQVLSFPFVFDFYTALEVFGRTVIVFIRPLEALESQWLRRRLWEGFVDGLWQQSLSRHNDCLQAAQPRELDDAGGSRDQCSWAGEWEHPCLGRMGLHKQAPPPQACSGCSSPPQLPCPACQSSLGIPSQTSRNLLINFLGI